jgi:hypothetical protein
MKVDEGRNEKQDGIDSGAILFGLGVGSVELSDGHFLNLVRYATPSRRGTSKWLLDARTHTTRHSEAQIIDRDRRRNQLSDQQSTIRVETEYRG